MSNFSPNKNYLRQNAQDPFFSNNVQINKKNIKNKGNKRVTPSHEDNSVYSNLKKWNDTNISKMVVTGFTKMDNELARAIVVETKDDSTAFLYFILLSHRNHKTNECYPSYEILAKETNTTPRTIVKRINLLITHGFVNVLPSDGSKSNRYFFPYEDFYNPDDDLSLTRRGIIHEEKSG